MGRNELEKLFSLPNHNYGSKKSRKRPRTKSVTYDYLDVVKDLLPTTITSEAVTSVKVKKKKKHETSSKRKRHIKEAKGDHSDNKVKQSWPKSGTEKSELEKNNLHVDGKSNYVVETDYKYNYDRKESFDEKCDKEKKDYVVVTGNDSKSNVLEPERKVIAETKKSEKLDKFKLDFGELFDTDEDIYDATPRRLNNKNRRQERKYHLNILNKCEKSVGCMGVSEGRNKDDAYTNEKHKKLVVKLRSDNRFAEQREADRNKEQTEVKTIELLTLDVGKTEEKQDISKEKEDLAEKRTTQYNILCRGSLHEEGDENCNSFMTDNSDDCLEGVEHSYYSYNESNESDLPSHSVAWDICSKSESWGGTYEKDEAELGGHLEEEKRDKNDCFESLRIADLQEDGGIADETTAGYQAITADDDIQELSEKEKLFLVSDDEKDTCDCCVVKDTDREQTQNDKTAEDINSKQTQDENTRDYIVRERMQVEITREKMENSSVMNSTAFEEEMTAMLDDIDITSVPFTYMIWVVMDTLLLFVTMETGYPVTIETRSEEDRLPSSFPVYPCEKTRSTKPTVFTRKYIHQNRDRGHGSSRSPICKSRRRKNAQVKQPNENKIIGRPWKNGSSRRLPWLQSCGSCVRRCSDSDRGAKGGGYHSNNGGSPEKGSGDHGRTGRRDRNNNGSRKNSNNNGNGGRDREGDWEGDSRNGSGDGSRKNLKRPQKSDPEGEDSNIPDIDFKRYRKKHSDINFDNFTSFLGALGALIEERKSPLWEHDNPIPDCLSSSLETPDEISEEILDCDICNVLNSMLKHFADCQEAYLMCSMCIQMFSFICIHAYECKKNEYECEIKLCKKFHQVLGDDTIPSRMKCLWFNIKKKLARVLGFDDGVMVSASNIPVNPPNLQSLGGTRGYNPSLESIPESGSGSEGSSSRSGSRVLARKRSNKLPSLPEAESLPPDVPVTGPPGVSADVSDHASTFEQSPQSRDYEVILRRAKGRKISASRYVSLPLTGGIEGFHGQYPSFTDRPVGTPGICEVMYGNIRQLVVVGKNWNELKAMLQREEPLPRPYREEGIILRQFKENLVIDEIRYQLQFQWLKVSHLGNGMSGKCHLATDFTTDFRFCVKEIHMRNFEVEEIELWSDLDHQYIVKLYGAIRHGEMIYIFSEFIDGGNLTEAINTQRSLNRRLSHQTALTLFQQLLEVLVYLKAKNILHEDLKADNILLHREKDNISIKVTDFGLATRINTAIRFGTKPVGTMTQWSPEKAECVGYGYPAEIWAAIVQQSPPVEDIPRNIPKVVRDLIERGFTVCQGQRPTPEELLKHEAFKLIKDRPQRSDAYSILDSTFHIGTTELEDQNSDLQAIIRDLETKKTKNSNVPVAEDLNKLISDVQAISLQVQKDVGSGIVYVLPDAQIEGQQTPQNSAATGGDVSATAAGHGNASAEQLPVSQENPLRHYQNYIKDDVSDISSLGTTVTPYQPGMVSNIEELQQSIQQQELENHALRTRLPHFEKIFESSSDPALHDDEDNDSENDEVEAPFDFNIEIEKVREKYLTPTPTEYVERNPMIPTLPLVIDSLITCSADTTPNVSITDSLAQMEITPKTVSNAVAGESYDIETASPEDAKAPETLTEHFSASGIPDFDENFTSDELFGLGPNEALENVVPEPKSSNTTDREAVKPEDEPKYSNTSDREAVRSGIVEDMVFEPKYSNTSGTEIVMLERRNEEDDLFGPDPLPHAYLPGAEQGDRNIGNEAVFPPMCSPSRNATTVSRPTATAHRFQQPLFEQASTIMQTPLNHNRFILRQANNIVRGQNLMNPSQRPYNMQQSDYQPGSREKGQQVPMNRSPQPQGYPYSFGIGQATERFDRDPTSLSGIQSSPNFQTPVTESTKTDSNSSSKFIGKTGSNPKLETPKIEMPATQFVLGPPSSTSSSGSQGDFNMSSISQSQSSEGPYLQLGVRDTQYGTTAQMKSTLSPSQLNTALHTHISSTLHSSQPSLATPGTQYDMISSGTSSTIMSFATSTPLKIPQKAKKEKDAMNEMLKSYKATHGAVAGSPTSESSDVASQPSSTGTSPQQQQRQQLHLDISAQGHTSGPVHHVQSAPAMDRRPSYPVDHHRVMPKSATPPKGGSRWPSESPGSSSTSAKMQLEEQALQLAALEKEIEAHSQHSHSHSESNLHLSLLEREDSNNDLKSLDDDDDDEAARENVLKYITADEDKKVTVLVVCANKEKTIKMKFSNFQRTWRDIVKDDLCRSAAIHNDVGCEQFCLKFEDGTPVDLRQPLGDNDITIMVVPASEDDPWFVQGGQIFFTE